MGSMRSIGPLLLASLQPFIRQTYSQSDTSLSFSASFTPISFTSSTHAASHTTYVGSSGQYTIFSSSSINPTDFNASRTVNNSSASGVTIRTTSRSVTVLKGSNGANPSTANEASRTSTSAKPTNTVPCNGFAEFCDRKYSNITNVCSHNSAFVVENNAASNQMLSINDQLNDGIRMLQGETVYENGTIWNCHTSCDLLNAGTWQSELETVARWLRDNPYDVLTILIGNNDQVSVDNYAVPIANAGLLPFVYTPTYVPQYRKQWPTLGEMILKNERLVFFMDYKANQSSVPYILDQYSHLLQTPFSPTDRSFPCTIDYPPGVNETDFRERFMYLANHNLNQAVDLSSVLGPGVGTILIPNTAELSTTNGQNEQYGELGAMASNCTRDWDRPPSFLVVDYYNIGSPKDGSVFNVAAKANNVTNTRPCCAKRPKSGGSAVGLTTHTLTLAVGLLAALPLFTGLP